MNIGIRLHDTAPGDLAQRLGFARAQGFSCAHLAMSKAVPGIDMLQTPRLYTDQLAGQVRRAFESQGVQCAVLGCYLQLADRDAQRLRQTQEIYRAHLRFSKKIGALVVGTETPPAAGVAFSEPAPVSEEAFALFVRCLEPVLRWAEEEDALLAVEPVATHIISTPARAERLLNALPSEHLRIILDAVNLLSPETAARADDIIADAVSRLGDRVSILHMKDYSAPRPDDAQLHSVACGTGVMRYERLLSFGKKRGLPMTLEDTRPDNAEAARLFLENAAKAL